MDRDAVLRVARILGVEAPERRSTEELLRTIRRRIREAVRVLETVGAEVRDQLVQAGALEPGEEVGERQRSRSRRRVRKPPAATKRLPGVQPRP
jgi:hypothetical protein